MITSRRHPRIKTLASLLTGKGRREEGQLLAEGLRLVREALHWAQVSALVVSEDFLREEAARSLIEPARERGVEVLEMGGRNTLFPHRDIGGRGCHHSNHQE